MRELSSPTLLSVEELSVFYEKFCALRSVNITVAAGEIVSIIGANGAGKSSLLKAIVAQADVEGSIRYDGRDITHLPTSVIVGSGIALVPEGRRLFQSLTVSENLILGWQVGRRGGPSLERIFDLFPALKDKRRQPARQLSGGQQQMVALGRALLADPRLLLCDEISLSLAPNVINDLYELLMKINKQGIAILLIEQDIGRALAIASRFYCLLEGRVSMTGRPEETDRETITRHYFGS